MMDEIVEKVTDNMAKTVSVFKETLSTLRTGRASPAILSRVEADYYGDKIKIDQISSITSPEPRQLLVKPYDRGDLKTIVSAINAADLGLNPIAEADSIRIFIPPLTEETRKDLVKKAKTMLEEAKVSIRNIRREFIDQVRNNDEMTEDYQKRTQDDIQKAVDEKMKELQDFFDKKEKDIMSI